MRNLKVEILLEKSDSALLTQRLMKFTIFSFFSSLAGSTLGILGGLGFLMRQIEGRVERKRQYVKRNHIGMITKRRAKLIKLNMTAEAEDNTANAIKYSSDSIFTTPNLCGSAQYKTFSIGLNLFNMYEKLKHRKDDSYDIGKVFPSRQEFS